MSSFGPWFLQIREPSLMYDFPSHMLFSQDLTNKIEYQKVINIKLHCFQKLCDKSLCCVVLFLSWEIYGKTRLHHRILSIFGFQAARILSSKDLQILINLMIHIYNNKRFLYCRSNRQQVPIVLKLGNKLEECGCLYS